MRAIGVLLSIMAGLAACGDEDRNAPPQNSPAGPLVTYEREGGVAGRPQRLVVKRDGRAQLTVTAGPDAGEEEFRVDGGELAEIERAVQAARGVEAPPLAAGCADCFVYTIQADGVDVQLDSVSYGDRRTPKPLAALVGRLDRLTVR